MKTKTTKLLALCGLALLTFSFSCEKECKPRAKPGDVKPIDWEGYNSVYDVVWNYSGYCADFEERYFMGGSGDTVSVYGWRAVFYTTSLNIAPEPTSRTIIRIASSDDKVWSKVNSLDLDKKIFVRGVIQLICRYTNGPCPRVAADIIVTNPDDIYTE